MTVCEAMTANHQGRVVVKKRAGALKTASNWRRDTIWTDGSHIVSGRVAASCLSAHPPSHVRSTYPFARPPSLTNHTGPTVRTHHSALCPSCSAHPLRRAPLAPAACPWCDAQSGTAIRPSAQLRFPHTRCQPPALPRRVARTRLARCARIPHPHRQARPTTDNSRICAAMCPTTRHTP